MIEIEMTSKDIERETGIRHDNLMRDVKSKWLSKHPLNEDNISLLNLRGQIFRVEAITYESRGKEYPAYKFNSNAANAFVSNYKLEHSLNIVAYVRSLEAQVEEQQRQLDIMKDIVWQVINGQAYIGQEQALKMAGVKHPRLFMKYLKSNKRFYNSVVYERSLLKHHQCNKHGDSWWKFTKKGFQWLLDGQEQINVWVEKQKAIEKLQNKVPC